MKDKPVEWIFTEVYKKNEWGGKPGTFYSGDGTHDSQVRQYIQTVREFISTHQIASVLEIGCGDFTVSKEILEGLPVTYRGCDVVEEMIQHHRRMYGSSQIQFEKLNAIEQPLPEADLLLIRQVLQHLSNAHISCILRKAKEFRYVIISEHLPVNDHVVPNVDKITGPHIRMKMNSGVFVDQAPFRFGNPTILLEYRKDDLVSGKLMPAVIRTTLIENPPA